MTLAFWLGRIGLTVTGGCCANAHTADVSVNATVAMKKENRLKEIIAGTP
jgi:hypothetical protein